jgi:hypothetical protein
VRRRQFEPMTSRWSLVRVIPVRFSNGLALRAERRAPPHYNDEGYRHIRVRVDPRAPSSMKFGERSGRDRARQIRSAESRRGRHRVCKPVRPSAEKIPIGFYRRNFTTEGSLITFLLFSIAMGIPAQVTAQRPSQPLSCDPKQVRSGDTLILRFRMPHPEELAIGAPGNGWYFLVFEPDPSTPQPIVDKASFAKMREMRLPVATAKGIPWAAGKNNPEVIFQRPGTYEVILTAALESDDVVPTYRCKVAFARNR